MTKIGMVTQVVERRVPKWTVDRSAPASPKFWDPLPTLNQFDIERRNLVW